MTTVSLDAIVRQTLLKRGYPLHWYMQFLVYAAECLRELTFDDLKVINTKLIPVDQTINAADLPSDFQGYVTVGAVVGQRIRPLTPTTTLMPLVNLDSEDNFAEQEWNENASDLANTNGNLYYGGLPYATWFNVNWNNYGENIGRFFGLGAGYQADTFQIVPERNQIQLDQYLFCENLVLQYFSDGQDADAATQIDPYAFKTIQSYILWQMKEHNRSYGAGERQMAQMEYTRERKILRARKADWSIEKLRRIVQKNTMASPKG